MLHECSRVGVGVVCNRLNLESIRCFRSHSPAFTCRTLILASLPTSRHHCRNNPVGSTAFVAGFEKLRFHNRFCFNRRTA